MLGGIAFFYWFDRDHKWHRLKLFELTSNMGWKMEK